MNKEPKKLTTTDAIVKIDRLLKQLTTEERAKVLRYFTE